MATEDFSGGRCFSCGRAMRVHCLRCVCGAAQRCVYERRLGGLQQCALYVRESRLCVVCGRHRLDLSPRVADFFKSSYHHRDGDSLSFLFTVLALLAYSFLLWCFPAPTSGATACLSAIVAVYETYVRILERDCVGPMPDGMEAYLRTARQRFERIEAYVEDLVAVLKQADDVNANAQ